jgi:hypothetical protein
MPRTPIHHHTFDDVIASLGNNKFDVAAASPDAKRVGGPLSVRISSHGCAAEIAPASDKSAQVLTEIVTRPGVVLGGEISRLLDRGYQKFLKTSKLEVPATAAHLRSLHAFTEQLAEAIGAPSLYNQSLGTTSDKYLYDRVAGRPSN